MALGGRGAWLLGRRISARCRRLGPAGDGAVPAGRCWQRWWRPCSRAWYCARLDQAHGGL